jgi:hypothetical protein
MMMQAPSNTNNGPSGNSTVMRGEKFVFNNITNNYYQIGGAPGTTTGPIQSLTSAIPNLVSSPPQGNNFIIGGNGMINEFKPFEHNFDIMACPSTNNKGYGRSTSFVTNDHYGGGFSL